MKYFGNRPSSVLAVWLWELSTMLLSASFFVGLPAGAAVMSFSSPWRFVGIPLGILSSLVALALAVPYAMSLRDGLGTRLVPQFERPLGEDPQTYFSGQELVRAVRVLDQRVKPPLSSFITTAFHQPHQGLEVIARLVASVAPTAKLCAELSVLKRALDQAVSENIRFRLVVIADTGINSEWLAQLRARGF